MSTRVEAMLLVWRTSSDHEREVFHKAAGLVPREKLHGTVHQALSFLRPQSPAHERLTELLEL